MPVLSEKLLVPVDVVVDSREAAANEDLVTALRRKGVRVAIAELSAGDYYLLANNPSQALLIERKTVIDFANSIRDGRIWDQVRKLKEAAETDGIRCAIVLEGWLGLIEKRTRWNITSVLRIIDEIVLDWGVPIIPTHSKEATALWIAAKARSLGRTEEKRVVRLRVDKKPPTLHDRILYVAEGLVGPTLARKLLAHFKTLRSIANASVAELMKVEGIGEKRAREIYAIFNTPWVDAEGQKY
jgi:ERCC4-type nuclease